MNNLGSFLRGWCVYTTMTSCLFAQEILFEIDGAAAGDQFGFVVSDAGDVNNDTIPDFIVGSSFNDTNGTDAGRATVYSGSDGSVLYDIFGAAAGDNYGSGVGGVGDLNADNHDDFIVGALGADNNGSESGSVTVYSGIDGSVLFTHNGDNANARLGNSVSGAGDVNQDTVPDYIAGARRDDQGGGPGSGSARVFSGADGSTLYTFGGDLPFDEFGFSVSDAGDVNMDGFDDVIVGARLTENNGHNSGMARVFSGQDGSILHEFLGDHTIDEFGFSVSGAGDVNNDGYADLIVGAYLDDNNSLFESGMARVFSGQDGSILHQFDGESVNVFLGTGVSGIGDVNLDGYDDLLVGSLAGPNPTGTRTGSARVYSGMDGCVLLEAFGNDSGDNFGISVSGLGDIDGDLIPDFIVGANGDDDNGMDSGSLKVISGNGHLRASAKLLSAAAGGTVTYDIDFPDSQAGMNYAFLGSQSGTGPVNVNGVDIPLTNDLFFQQMSSGGAPAAFSGAYGILDASGNGVCTLSAPPGAATQYIGQTFWFSAVSYLPPQAVSIASIAVTLEVEP